MPIPPRLKRLYNDLDQMNDLHQRNGLVYIVAVNGDPPERYVVGFRCKGIVRLENDRPVFGDDHRAELALTVEYPMMRPQVRWKTPIFHPNFIRGDVCTGDWYPKMMLREFCIVLAEMVQYKIYNTTSPLDMDAAMWAMRHRSDLPVDARDVLAPLEWEPVVATAPTELPPQASPLTPARFCRMCRWEFTDPEMRFCPHCNTPRRM